MSEELVEGKALSVLVLRRGSEEVKDGKSPLWKVP